MVNRFFHCISGSQPRLRVLGQCILCGDLGQAELDICIPCSAELPRLHNSCQWCALPLADQTPGICGRCQQSPPPFQRSVAIWLYLPPIARLISGFKYQQHYSFGYTLSSMAAKEFASAYKHSDLPELIIPTPLHWYRRLRRGFNQSERIAAVIARHLNIPVAIALKRARATPAPRRNLRRSRHLLVEI